MTFSLWTASTMLDMCRYGLRLYVSVNEDVVVYKGIVRNTKSQGNKPTRGIQAAPWSKNGEFGKCHDRF